MEYAVLVAVSFWLIHRYLIKKRNTSKPSSIVMPSHSSKSGIDEVRKQNNALDIDRQSRGNPRYVSRALTSADSAVTDFILNHDSTIEDIERSFNGIELPEDLA